MRHISNRKALLLDILQEMAPESSKNTLRLWLQTGRISVDQQNCLRANTEILPGQEIRVGPKVAFLKASIRILYEDESLVVVCKPEGLLSVATDFENRATVHTILKQRFHHPRVYPVHRLDRETSGVMMFTYTETARDRLKVQFEQHLVDKTYFALVEGEMELGKGTWTSFLEEDDFYYVKSKPKGKLAITHYEVLKIGRGRSFLRLKPETGRKNQLRVHCSEAGHPMIGDKKYDASSNPIHRLCLHAQKLSFSHPSTGRRMTFSTALPESFNKVLEIKDLKI